MVVWLEGPAGNSFRYIDCEDVHHRYPADGDVTLCGSDLLVAAVGTHCADASNQEVLPQSVTSPSAG